MSGGPVYLTDIPGKHNIDLIEKLVSVTRNGARTLLRSRQSPVPTFKTALGNPMGTHALLCLYNINREENELDDEEESAYAVYGFWNTGPCIRLGVVETSELIHLASIFKSFSVAHIVTGLDQGIILPLFPLSGPKDLHGASALLTRVAGFGSSLISISCTKSLKCISIACLGLLDKLNGSRAILKTKMVELNHSSAKDGFSVKYSARLSHKSKSCGFWISKCSTSNDILESRDIIVAKVVLDKHVLISDKDWHWNKSSNLLTVNMLSVSSYASDTDYFLIEIFINSTMI
jgi:hypothetical protein